MTPEDENQLIPFLRLAAQKIVAEFGTEYEDTLQECWAWVLDKDKSGARRADKLLTWMSAGRYRQALFAVRAGVGRNGYGRKEKAARLGKDYRDLDPRKHRDRFVYSADMVAQWLPAAVNSRWTPQDDTVDEGEPGKRGRKAPGEWGNAMAIVMDIRRALAAGHRGPAAIANWLNGEHG